MRRHNTHPATPKIATNILAAALALSLGVLPLAACGSKPADSTATEPTEQTDATPASIDVSSWKTLGDALATRTGSLSYGHDETYFVAIIEVNDSIVRMVCKSDPSVDEKLSAIEFDDPEHDQKVDEALADLELLSAEDITDTKLSQEELDAYVGKTGQDMLDAGFEFSYYSMYGGEDTDATMDYGYFSYEVIFDTTVTEDQTEDEGASITGATVKEIQSFGNLSNMSLDPTRVE